MREEKKHPTNKPAETAQSRANSWKSSSFLVSLILFLYLIFSGYYTLITNAWGSFFFETTLYLHLWMGNFFVLVSCIYIWQHLKMAGSKKDRRSVLGTYIAFIIVEYICVVIETVAGAALVLILFFGSFFFFRNELFEKKNKRSVMLGFVGAFCLLGSAFTGLFSLNGNLRLITLNYLHWSHLIFNVALLGMILIHILDYLKHREVARDWHSAMGRKLLPIAVGTLILIAGSKAYDSWTFPEATRKAWPESKGAPNEKTFGAAGLLATNYARPSEEVIAKSKSCGADSPCHPTVYAHWESSMHRFGGNRVVRKVASLLQEEAGTETSYLCAGCHYPTALLAGKIQENFADQTDEIMAEGISCVVCHAIGNLGAQKNGGYHVRIPFRGNLLPLSPVVDPATGNQIRDYRHIRSAITLMRPELHVDEFFGREKFYKKSEYCSVCHYLVLGEGEGTIELHATYKTYTDWKNKTGKDTQCQGCHMPLRQKHVEILNVRSHRFYGGNNAIEELTADFGEYRLAKRLIGSPISRSGKTYRPRGVEFQTQANIDWLQGKIEIPEVGLKKGPIIKTTIKPLGGNSGLPEALKIITFNEKVGHAFPTENNNLYQVWLEVTVTNDRGREVFRLGGLDDKNYLKKETIRLGNDYVDAEGKPLEHDRVWAIAKRVRERVIQPQEAIEDIVDLTLPPGVRSPLTAIAVWRYRKIPQDIADWVYGEQKMTFPITDISSAKLQF